MTRLSGDVLVYVEDPGAATFLAELPAALQARGRRVVTVAESGAIDVMTLRGVAPEPLAGRHAMRLLADYQPTAVVVGTAENVETPGLALIDAARSAGITSIGAVDSVTNAAFRFRGVGQSPLQHAPDWLWVPDAETSAAFVRLGFPSHRVVITGHPQVDRLALVHEQLGRESRASLRARCFHGLDPERPVIVFVAESSHGFEPAQFQRGPSYTLTGRGRRDDRTALVLEELIDARDAVAAHAQLALRMHPKNRLDEFTEYLPAISWTSSGGDPLQVVYAADLVVGMTSMLLYEAALLGVRTLAVLPQAAEASWLASARSGLTPWVATRADLQRELGELARLDTTARRFRGEPGRAVDRMIDWLERQLNGVPLVEHVR